ncbi:hypothetical protein ACNOYE_16170 [Nannocystaceae bacterium ST9]
MNPIEADPSRYETTMSSSREIGGTERTKPSAGSAGSDARTPDIGPRGGGGSRSEGPRSEGPRGGPRSEADSTNEPKPSTADGARSELARVVGRGIAAVRKYPVRAVVGAFALGWISGRGMPKVLVRTAMALALRSAIDQLLADRVTTS